MRTETKGDRVRLIHCSDPYTTMPYGALGTVMFIDDMGTVHVKWDNGAALGLIAGEDLWEVVK